MLVYLHLAALVTVFLCPVCRGDGYNTEADFQRPGSTVLLSCTDCQGHGWYVKPKPKGK